MLALKIIGYGIEVACIIAQIMLLKTIIDFRKKRKKKEKNCAAKKEWDNKKAVRNNFSSPEDEKTVQKFINEYFESISGDEERRHPYD